MDIIIEQYKNYDQENYAMTLQYLTKHDLLNKIPLNDTDQLLLFAIEYGLLGLVQFLYEEINIAYDINMLNQYSEPTTELDDVYKEHIVENVTHFDRNQCLKYLNDMKRYSKYQIINKHFIYKYNKK